MRNIISLKQNSNFQVQPINQKAQSTTKKTSEPSQTSDSKQLNLSEKDKRVQSLQSKAQLEVYKEAEGVSLEVKSYKPNEGSILFKVNCGNIVKIKISSISIKIESKLNELIKCQKILDLFKKKGPLTTIEIILKTGSNVSIAGIKIKTKEELNKVFNSKDSFMEFFMKQKEAQQVQEQPQQPQAGEKTAEQLQQQAENWKKNLENFFEIMNKQIGGKIVTSKPPIKITNKEQSIENTNDLARKKPVEIKLAKQGERPRKVSSGLRE